MPQARSGRTKARSGAKEGSQDGEAEKKKTFIVKIPAKTSEVTTSVFDSEPSLVTAEERGADTDFTQTIILQAQQEEASSAEDQNFSEFSIPIEMVGGGDKGDFDQDLYGRISLSDQLSLNTNDLSQAGDIRNHVISIEENGRITIGIDSQFQGGAGNLSTILEEPLVTPKQPHTPPKFPEWWLRLSSTLLSFLSTGYLVDVWLVCCDGEAVPAHQLLLSHASPRLASWLAEAARDTQEEAVTVSLPDWDSDTVGQFVSALYQGQLPALRNSQEKIRELADVLGINLQKNPPRSTSIVRKNLPKLDAAKHVMISSKSSKSNTSPLKSEIIKKEPSSNVDQPLGPMQIVQTETGQILLLTGDLNNFQQDNVETKVDPISIPERVSSSYQTDEEVEKIKAVKIAEIKEQQGKQCPICYNTAINHRVTTAGAEQKFAYKCCHTDCNVDNLKTARAFNQHISRHNGLNAEPASKVCPLCMRPRIEHKNRGIADEDKGNHRGNLYKCCHCMASKLSAKKFFLHMENHVSKKHVCEICNKGYSYKHLLNEHHYKEHGEGQDVRYPCEFEGCDYSAKYKQTLHTHVMERHHGIKRKHRQTDAYKRINCPTCGKTLKQWYYHQFHKKSCTVGGGTLYQCELCGKEGFINAVTLENHKRTKHSVERPFSCEYCPAKYATAMSLSGHRARKHGVNSKGETVPKKLFPCDVCGKLLTSRLKLQTHVEVIHEGRRDYKCRFCDKTFTSKSNLQIHEGSLHTGVLPYKCEYCSKMFARRNQLNTHKESQHPGHAGPFYVVEDVNSVQVEDYVVEGVEDGVEISVGVDSVNIMEEVSIA